MISFIHDNNNTLLLILIYESNLEFFLFSHLFSNNKNHFHYIKKQVLIDKNK